MYTLDGLCSEDASEWVQSPWQLTPSHEGRQYYVLDGMVRPFEIETLTAALFKGEVNYAREKYVNPRPAWPVDSCGFSKPCMGYRNFDLVSFCRREKRKSAQKLVIKMHSFFVHVKRKSP